MIGSATTRVGQPIRTLIVVGKQDGCLRNLKRSSETVESSATVGPALLETGALQC